MSKIKLNNKITNDDKRAAIIAQVALDTNPYMIATSRFNRYAKQFGVPTMSHLELEDFETDLANMGEQKTPALPYHILLDVYHHRISLRDIVGTNETDNEWDRKVQSGFTTQAENHQLTLDMKRGYRNHKRSVIRLVNNINEVLRYNAKNLKDLAFVNSYKPIKLNKHNNKSALIIILSDVHLGAYIEANSHGYDNKYNIIIAKHRFHYFIKHSLEKASKLNVSKLYLVDLGDNIDNTLQANNTLREETSASHQFVIFQHLLIKAISHLSHYYPVSFINIAGNHDRIDKNFRTALPQDNYSYILENTLINLTKGHRPYFHNVKILDNRDNIYRAYAKILGRNFLFIHGDRAIKPSSKQANNNIAKLESSRVPVDSLVFGHYHHFFDINCNGNKRETMVGSMMGFNGYSTQIGTPASPANQEDILVQQHQAPVVIPIDLSSIQS